MSSWRTMRRPGALLGLVILLVSIVLGCAPRDTGATNAPDQDTGGIAVPNPVAPAAPARDAVNDINAHTGGVEGAQPGDVQQP